MQPFVDIADVSLIYQGGSAEGTLALEGATLRIDKGEFVAVVGPSGCGKSTLLKLVSGLNLATRGGVIVAEREVSAPLSIVGMAFQNPVMLPWRTTIENVLLPLEIVEPHASRYRSERSLYREKARELLSVVGLDGFTDHYPWQLSGGMQQRASIARALSFDPTILLMDEPFGALDEITRERMNRELLEVWRETAATVLFITHSIAEAVFLSSRVVVMTPRPGRIGRVVTIDLPRPRADRIRADPTSSSS
jgi:NitT/TauT family transport system ATP-binding protein